MMLEKVKAAIDKYQLLQPDERVVVGVSGGADSMALLHCLVALGHEYNVGLHVAHLNHMFRPEAVEEARFVTEIAEAWGVSITACNYDVPQYIKEKRLSPQEAAREIRYAFFQKVAEKMGASKIAVGQHADDQAETVLMHLIRGGGAEGLMAIEPLRGKVIRPLLGITRNEIEGYCRINGIPFCQDPSNKKPVYLRNRIRMELIPLLKDKYNPQIVGALGRTACILRDDHHYLEKITTRVYEELVGGVNGEEQHFPLDKFLDLEPSLQRRLVRRCFERLAGKGKNLSYQHVDEVLSLAEKADPGKQVTLPLGYVATRDYTSIRMSISGQDLDKIRDYAYQMVIPGITAIPEIGAQLEAEIIGREALFDPVKATRYEAFLDYQSLELPLIVRLRHCGDRFQPLGMGGASKKLKDYFIDLKVPKDTRDRIPLVVTQKDAVWVVGYRIDERWKVTGSTRLVLHLRYHFLSSEIWT
ncbi:MAG: tRNA lysidine(34) synthetase TilS [Bacillota bacterium]